MALSVSSLASAFSHLSLPSTSAPHPPPLLRLLPSPRRAPRLVLLSASASDAPEPVDAPEPAVDEGPEEVLAVEAEEDALVGLALRKYVKQRLPGGFAAQRITATGRRKTASARVVLQEGSGKVFINFRDAKVCCYLPPRFHKCTSTAATFCDSKCGNSHRARISYALKC
jgi:small subunit ribosomal protein S9